MSLVRPSATLEAEGLTFRFDTTDSTAAPMMAGLPPALLEQRRIKARHVVRDWLTQWAIWLDRDREPAIVAAEHWNAEPILRAALKLDTQDAAWSAPWLLRETMPIMPGRAARMLHMPWLPLYVRRGSRRAIARYQRQHGQWLATQRVKWQDIRRRALEARVADSRFQDACVALRASLDAGSGQAATAAMLRSILLSLSPQLHLLSVQFEGWDGMRLSCQYGGAPLERRRRQSRDDLSGLLVEEGEEIARQRLSALGHVVALSVADLLRLLETTRRQVELSLSQIDVTQAPFVVRFQSTNDLGFATDILADIRARETPSVLEWSYTPISPLGDQE